MSSDEERGEENSAMLAEDVRAFVTANAEHCEVTPNGKVRFSLTEMEFPPSVSREDLQRHLSGKAMRRALVAKRNSEFDFSAHAKWIVPHREKNKNYFLWCRLTKRTLPRDAQVVRAHVAGRRYKAALRKAQEAAAERERVMRKRAEKARKRRAALQTEKREGGDGEEEDEGDGGADDDDASGSDIEGSADGNEMSLSDGDDGVAKDLSLGSDGEETALVGKKGGYAPAADDGDDEDIFWTHGRVAPDGKGKKSSASRKPANGGALSSNRNESTKGRSAAELSSSDGEDEWGDLKDVLAKRHPVSDGGKSTNGRTAEEDDSLNADAAETSPVKSTGHKRRREKAAVQKKSRRPRTRVRSERAEPLVGSKS